jgi:hypothetical protein
MVRRGLLVSPGMGSDMIGLSVSNRRARHRWLTIVAIAVAVAVGGGVALGSEIGVIESYGGARPKDAALILAPLVKELEGRGHVGPRQIGPRVAERVSLPGSLGAEAVQRAIRLAEQGRRHWIEAEFDQAVAVLEEAVSRRDLHLRKTAQPTAPLFEGHWE